MTNIRSTPMHFNSMALLLRWICLLLQFSMLVSAERSNSKSIDPTVTMATLRRVWRRGEKDSVPALLGDLTSLHEVEGNSPILTATSWQRDSSYTKSWTNADWEFHQVWSLRRYCRHLRSWFKSPTALAVFPAVLAVMAWSALVFVVAHHNPPVLEALQVASLSTGLGAFTAPISLLLALRTNRALNRLLEARSVLGIMVRAAGTLAGLSATYVMPLDESKALLMGRYLSIYGWIMKGYMRGEDPSAVLRMVLPPEEAAWIEQSPADAPTAILFRLRQLVASCMGELSLTAANVLEDRIKELEVVLGVCKRLVGSPIPPTYTRHTSRVLCLFLGMLPVALVGNDTALGAILVNVALLSYVFVGIDEIGVEIEHPFPLLPMYHLAMSIQKNASNQFIMSQQQQQQQHQQPIQAPFRTSTRQ